MIRVTFVIDTDSLYTLTDSYLAAVWQVIEAHPPQGKCDAIELRRSIGAEFLRRGFVKTAPGSTTPAGN